MPDLVPTPSFARFLVSVQNIHQLLLHVDVNIAVADKSAGVVGMAGEGGDQVLVLDFLVDIPDKCAAGHVAAGDLIDWTLYLLSG